MTHTNNKSITILEQERMYRAGEKERYCLTQLVEILNCNDQYHFQLFTSESWRPVGYDAVIFVRCKLTDNILDILIVETKVRDTHFDELVFEKKKLNTMNTERTKWVKKMCPSINPKIVYISFTPKGTYMFSIDILIENNLMPKLTKMKMNNMTVAENVEKVSKQVYLLPIELATYKKFKFDATVYANTLIDNSIKQLDEAKTILKTTYSIF